MPTSTIHKEYPGDPALITFLLNHLKAFTGNTWEQEDDVTMMVLQRTSSC